MVNNKQIPIKYSQNLLKANHWLEVLVKQKTKITKEDTVIDIGAGTGTLTGILASNAKQVVAYELDPILFKQIPKFPNVTKLNCDFLTRETNEFGKDKVFANIPFFLTSAIVRKLFLESANAPIEAHLFMQLEAAYRIIGKPYEKDTLLPLLLKPFWEIKISHTFQSSDFQPAPSVKVVLVSFYQLKDHQINRSSYQDFVSYVLNKRKANIKLALLDLFTFNQLKIIAKELNFNLADPPGVLPLSKWLGLWDRFQKLVTPEKKARINGAYAKITRHQEKLNQAKQIIL